MTPSIHELFREQHVLLETVILSIEMATFLFLPLIFVVFLGTFLHRTANKTAPKSNNRSNTIIPHVLLIFERGKTKYLITYEVFKGLGIQQLSPWTWNDFYGGRWDAPRSLSKYFPRKKRGRFGNKAKKPIKSKNHQRFLTNAASTSNVVSFFDVAPVHQAPIL